MGICDHPNHANVNMIYLAQVKKLNLLSVQKPLLVVTSVVMVSHTCSQRYISMHVLIKDRDKSQLLVGPTSLSKPHTAWGVLHDCHHCLGYIIMT